MRQRNLKTLVNERQRLRIRLQELRMEKAALKEAIARLSNLIEIKFRRAA